MKDLTVAFHSLGVVYSLWQYEAIFCGELCGQRLCLFSGEDGGRMDRKGHGKRIMNKTCLVTSVASETIFSITLARVSSGEGEERGGNDRVSDRQPVSSARIFLLGHPQSKSY